MPGAVAQVVLTGAKKREDIYRAFESIYPVLQTFRKGGECRLVASPLRSARLQAWAVRAMHFSARSVFD